MTNVIPLKRPTIVKVVLTEEDRNIILSIEDNGKGLAKENFAESQTLALLGIRERVDYLGGAIIINEIKNRTSMTISIPCLRHA